MTIRIRGAVAVGLVILLWVAPAAAFRVIGSSSSGWVRWDAAPRFIGGEERSLEGGLRYSIETGSYADLRDQFLWVPFAPTTEDFAAAIGRAFEHWTLVDPETGLPGAVYFVEDLATPAVDAAGIRGLPGSFIGVNPGAEIDLFAEIPHAGPQFGASVIFFMDAVESDLTLTSGTTGYPGLAIAGADIRINPGFAWSLRGFEVLLTHEIGHALGLADLEAQTTPGVVSAFLDDNYDPTSSVTAAATLQNSFALEIDPYDPDLSPLLVFEPSLNGDPGLLTNGVELLMESDDIFALLFAEPKLQNDEFAGRQFLYPVVVPEASFGFLIGLGFLGLYGGTAYRRARIRRSESS